MTSQAILYIPQSNGTAFGCEVLHENHRVGAFRTQDQGFRHALMLAESIGKRSHCNVLLKIESETGAWETVTVYESVH